MARASRPRRSPRRPPGAGEPEPHQDREHQVEGDLGGQAPHLRQTVGQVVVDVDVGQQQRRDPLGRLRPRGCPAAVSWRRRPSRRRRGPGAGHASRGSAPSTAAAARHGVGRSRAETAGSRTARRRSRHRRRAATAPSRRPGGVGAGPEGGVRGEDGDGRHRRQGVEDAGRRPRIPDGPVEHGGECPTRRRAQHYSARMLLLRRVHAVLSRVVSEARVRGVREVVGACVRWAGGWITGRPPRVASTARSRGTVAAVAVLRARLPLHVAQRACRRGRLGARPPTSATPGRACWRSATCWATTSPFEHTVIDKYEQAPGVLNEDVADLDLRSGASTWCWRSRRSST